MDQAEKDRIIAALNDKGVSGPCPRCGNNGFTIVDGYSKITVQKTLTELVLGGPSIPAIITACTKCGYISTHAAGALGLLPKPEEEGRLK